MIDLPLPLLHPDGIMPKTPRQDLVLLTWEKHIQHLAYNQNKKGQPLLGAFLGEVRQAMPNAYFVVLTDAYIDGYNATIRTAMENTPNISAVLRVPMGRGVSFHPNPNTPHKISFDRMMAIYPGARRVILDCSSNKRLESTLGELHDKWFINRSTCEELTQRTINLDDHELLEGMMAFDKDPKNKAFIKNLISEMKSVIKTQGSGVFTSSNSPKQPKAQESATQGTFFETFDN